MFTSGLIISDCAILLPGAVKGFEVWNFAKLCFWQIVGFYTFHIDYKGYWTDFLNICDQDETGSKHLFLFYINNIDIVQTRRTYEAKWSILFKKRLHINITCKSAIYLYMLTLQAGDIQIQPGPTYIKYPCGICSKNVNWNAKALQCDGCDICYHTKCSSVPPHIYKALQGNNHGYFIYVGPGWICMSPACRVNIYR
jgi:hypothetical protein